jgi:Spy/CpxP family protein refolding chaperone
MLLKNKFFSTLTVAGALFAFSTFAAAQETPKTDSDNTQKREWRKGKRDGMGGKGFRRGAGMFGLRELNLTDQQREQIRTVVEANRGNQTNFEELKALREARRDGTLTDAQKERIKALRQERRAQSENVRTQILAILTPEQRQQLEAKKAEMQKRREERREQRRERRQNQQNEDQDN